MTIYKYCETQKKVVPIDQVVRQSRAIDYMTSDEMEPTRNPLNSKEIYTSRSKLRRAYRAAGAEEIGDAYDRGYNPEKVQQERQTQLVRQIKHSIAERLQYGRK